MACRTSSTAILLRFLFLSHKLWALFSFCSYSATFKKI